MKRTSLLFVLTLTLLALTFMPAAKMEVLEAAPFIPPTVTLTSPPNNSSFIAGSTIQLSANASDSDGSVIKVEFFQGVTKLGEDTSAPYSFDWTNVAAGNYILTAVATDNQAQVTTSSAVNVFVLSQARQYASWSSITNGTDLGNGTVRKTSTGSWDFGALATQKLFPGDSYFESTAASSISQSIALDSPDGQNRYIIVGTGTWVGIYENHVEVAATCCRAPNETIPVHAAGDRYRLEVSNGKLLYVKYRAGARTVLFISNAALPPYPYALSLHSSLQNAEWQNSVVAQLTRKATWSSLTNGIDLGNGTVRKTSTGTWDFSAVPAQQLLPGDGYVESTASSFNQSIVLNANDGQHRYIMVGTGGWAGIYENNVEVAATCCRAANETIPVHAAGDRYRLEISNGKLLYVKYRAGVRTVMFTSNAALPPYPLTTSLHASPQNAEWQNSVIAQLTTNATWSSITNGIDVGNGTLRKTSAGTWDFSAVARQQLFSGSGYFESTASSYNQAIVLNATDGQYRYILLGTGSWAGITENGVEVASTCCRAPSETIAPHIPGDRYRLEVSRGKLRYVRYRSGVRSVMFTSPNPLPPYPFGFSFSGSFQNSEWQNTIFKDNVPEHNDAVFVSQTMATTLSPGQSTSATVTMRNTGASTWTPDGDYQLASENLSDNQTWGLSRVNLTSVVPPGSDAVFNFTVTAPATPGAYSFQWRMVQPDVQRFGALSTNVTVTTVNGPPTVALTGPANNATFNTGSTIALTATASDSDGTISKVEFFQGTTKLGEDTTFPYGFSWTNVAAGSYQLTARATDNIGAVATSDPVNITVITPNQLPSVSLTSPQNNDIFTAPANITLTAGASDADGIVTKVQFFQGTTLLFEDLSEPFTFTWNNVAAANYNLTAKAFDNAGATATSAVVAIKVNTLPTVSLTAPTSGQVFTAPAGITLTATAADSDGTVSKVQFFNGTTLLNEDFTFPYTFNWTNVAAGNYSLTATVFDNSGGTATSAAIPITVNTLPTVSITSPTNPATFAAPATFTITASATDPDGSINKVEFFSGAVLLGEDNTVPYTFTYNNVSVGSYTLTAKATDNLGGIKTSTAVGVTVTNAPSISITSPLNNASFITGSNIVISASASDTDGTVAKVEFFKNGVLLGEDTTPPYSFSWSNVPSGNYSLTARATDNLGITTTSAPVNIIVSVLGISRIDPLNRTGGGGEDPFSRNYNWSVPLLSLPGRAGLNLGLSLSYNSLVWTRDGNFITFDADKGFPSAGFRLGFPTIQGPFFNSAANKDFYLLIASDGSHIELRQVGSGQYEAVDASYLLLDTNAMVLSAADGTQMTYVSYGTELQCTKIKDRNGNFITINRDGAGLITTIVDTVSRTINFNYMGGSLTSITQSWKALTHTWASFQYRSPDLIINTNFQNVTNVGPQNSATRKVLSGVTLPDSSRYEFEYTSWGQVWKISQFANDNGVTLLNYRSYDLPLDNAAPQQDCPRFTQRHDWAKYWNRNESGIEQEATTSFLWEPNASWTMPPSNTADSGIMGQVTMPDGTSHKVYAHASGWDKGLPVLTETYDNSPTPARQRQVTTAWIQENTNLTVPMNPRVTETNTFDAALNRKRTRVAYASFPFGPTTCWLPQDIFEYKNATEILRSTRTTYNVADAYKTRRIIGLVSERAIYDGDVTAINPAAPLVSKSIYNYDEANSIEATTEPVQHDPSYDTTLVLGRGNLTSVKRYNIDTGSDATVTSSKYNTAGSVVSSKDASDHQVTISYEDAFAANGTTLDPARNFITLAYPTMTTNAGGISSKTRYNYDFGAATWKQTPLPNQPDNIPGPQTTFTYDSFGRLELATNLVNSARQRYVYGPNYVQSWSSVNNASDEAYSLQVTDGAGRVIGTAKNHPGSDEGYSGQRTFYDPMGRPIKQSNPTETSITIPDPAVPINPYAWAADGDDETWYYTQQTYDWKGRPLVTTNQDDTTIITSYSSCGCAGAEVITITDEGTIDFTDLVTPRRRQEKYYSDILGRSVKHEVLNWVNGNVLAATVTTYDVGDKVKKERRFAGPAPTDLTDMSCPSPTCQLSEMTYDGFGRLKTRHTPSQQVDPNNPASTDHTTWEYYADDTIQKITDPRGTVSTFTYNSRHLVTGINYTLLPNVPTTGPSGVSPTAAVGYEYDAAGNRTRMTDGMGYVEYDYDQLSRLTSEDRFFSNLSNSATGGHYVITYGYNLANALTSVRDPFNAQVNYDYDTSGRLSGVTGSGFNFSTFISSIEYRAWGAPRTVVHGNNRTAKSTYDPRMRLSTYELISVPQDSLKLHNQYDYYADGRLRKLTDLDDHEPSIIGAPDTARHFSRVYTHGPMGDLLKARGFNTTVGIEMDQPFKQFYSYNSFGNLTSRSGSYYYQQSSTSDSGTFVDNRRQDWVYAADGQETHSTAPSIVRDWKYDTSGKLVQVKETVTATSQFSTFVTSFDGDGQQAREFIQESQAGSDRYLIRSTVLGEVLTRLNSSGAKTGTIVHIDKRVTPVKIGTDGAGFVGFTHVDPLDQSFGGDTKTVIDPMGNGIGWQPVPTGPSPLTYPRSSASMGSLGSLGSTYGSGQDRGCVYNDLPISCAKLAHYINLGVVNAVVRGVERPVVPLGLGMYEIWVPDKDGKKLGKPVDDPQNDIVRVNKNEDDLRGHLEFWFVPQRYSGGITGTQLKSAAEAVVKNYKNCFDGAFGPGSTVLGTRHLPGIDASILTLAAGELNADTAARVAGIFSQESDFELDPSKWGNDTGPAQLTGAVFKYWPEAVTGRPFGDRQVIKKTGKDKGKPAVDKKRNFNANWFSQDILDNMATLRNIVKSYNSDYDAAFAYGPGPDSERVKYATEVTARTSNYKVFFWCLLDWK